MPAPVAAAPVAAGQTPFAALPPKIRAAAVEFEASFLAQMLQPMFQGLKSDGPFGGGQSEGVFRSLLVDEYARSMARSGGVGVAQAVGNELLKMQEMKQEATR
jgi:Rod binding domain-containing protein